MVKSLIEQIGIDYIKKIYNSKMDYLIDKNFFDLDSYYKNSKKILNELLLEIISKCLSEIDDEYNRKRNNAKVLLTHRKKSKPFLMEDGVLTLSRNRYINRIDNKPFYYLDNLLHLEKRQRISNSFQESIIKSSVEKSYKSVEEKFNNTISVQTAMNIVKKYDKYIDKVENKKDNKKKIDTLYIEADEDHIHLLDQTQNKGKLVKLIYIHEGYRLNKVTNKRELINPHYFSSTDNDIWYSVSDYVYKYYDYSKIQIHGDGALWIKSGVKYFYNAEFYLDKFHTYQAIRRISGGKILKASKIIEEMKDNKTTYLENLFEIKYQKKFKGLKTINTMHGLTYLINNTKYNNLSNKEICCSAEGHISHILSSRMSSRPMAWSVDGAKRMARYRSYMYNKLEFKELIDCHRGIDKKKKEYVNIAY